jgi:predicted enzyme related to lactoylglutathione lyase
MDYVSAVLVHVPDMTQGLDWYRRAFPRAVLTVSQPSGFQFLQIGQTQLEIVLSDKKVASGAAGTVVYWWTEDFAGSLDHFVKLGAILYRGPLRIDGDLIMCQVRDPWGNCIGLRGIAPNDDNL